MSGYSPAALSVLCCIWKSNNSLIIFNFVWIFQNLFPVPLPYHQQSPPERSFQGIMCCWKKPTRKLNSVMSSSVLKLHKSTTRIEWISCSKPGSCLLRNRSVIWLCPFLQMYVLYTCCKLVVWCTQQKFVIGKLWIAACTLSSYFLYFFVVPNSCVSIPCIVRSSFLD